MVTQAPRKSAIAIAIAFTLSCIGLMVFVWTQFGGTIPLEAQGYRIHALFPESGLLVPNADVRISGVNVGKVVSVQAKGLNSLVTMDIQRQYAPVPRDTRAILRQKTLLGEAYVELSTGTGTGPKFHDGDTIPSSHIAPTQALDQVLSSFDHPTQVALQQFLNGSFQAIAGRGQDLNNAIGNLDPAVNELAALVGALNDQGSNLQLLINNTGSVLGALGARSADLQSLVTAGDQVMSATAQRDTALTATVNALPPFLAQLKTTLGDLGTTLGIAGPTLHALRPVAPLVPPALRDVIGLSKPAIKLLRQTPTLISDALHALPAITRFNRALLPAAQGLLPAIREVAPMMDFAGPYSQEIVTAMANLAAVLNAQAPANTTEAVDGVPAGQAKYLRAALPLNNESIFGQSVREPTNRHNAERAPGGMSMLASGGLLSSDCANTGDTSQIPLPLGNGNVPCRVQPGWTFKGVTAQFQRLTRAPK